MWSNKVPRLFKDFWEAVRYGKKVEEAVLPILDVEPLTKSSAEIIFQNLGLTTQQNISDYYTIAYRTVRLLKGEDTAYHLVLASIYQKYQFDAMAEFVVYADSNLNILSGEEKKKVRYLKDMEAFVIDYGSCEVVFGWATIPLEEVWKLTRDYYGDKVEVEILHDNRGDRAI